MVTNTKHKLLRCCGCRMCRHGYGRQQLQRKLFNRKIRRTPVVVSCEPALVEVTDLDTQEDFILVDEENQAPLVGVGYSD
jgi:hypothetical protein